MATPAAPLTRECPYCRETIRLDALKCRYCGSSLLPAPDAAPPSATPSPTEAVGKPDHVTYVVDSDLIRFVKVAAAALSNIVVVGAYVGGVDIREEVSEAHKASVDAKTASDEIQKVNVQMATAKKEMDDSRAALAGQLKEVSGMIDEIRQNKVVSDQYVAGFRVASSQPASSPQPESSTGPKKSFTPPELARLYNFPANLDGSGQTVAIIELGGGYRIDDVQQYFQQLKLPVPRLTSVAVGGAANRPTTANSADGQVLLDVEVVGAIAPKANIVVYFSNNNDQGFTDAVHAAANNKKNPATVMLIGWGGPESTWTASSSNLLNDALHDAAVNHQITIVVAAGDSGVTDGVAGQQHIVDFPASSPWVLAVGGTTLKVKDGKVLSETVWNQSAGNQGATGGGVSKLFPQPDWQRDAHVPPFLGQSGRGIPDIAADADPESGFIARVDGQTTVIGGTTGASPLWAGLIALINQGIGHNLGYLNPVLYRSIGPNGALNDITQGNNSSHGVQGCTAGPGWDYCTGWGTPNGVRLLEAFRTTRP